MPDLPRRVSCLLPVMLTIAPGSTEESLQGPTVTCHPPTSSPSLGLRYSTYASRSAQGTSSPKPLQRALVRSVRPSVYSQASCGTRCGPWIRLPSTGRLGELLNGWATAAIYTCHKLQASLTHLGAGRIMRLFRWVQMRAVRPSAISVCGQCTLVSVRKLACPKW